MGARVTATRIRNQVTRRIIGQFHHPHGLGGALAGWVMAHRASNRRRNVWVVSVLGVQPADRVMEIGFGPGIAIDALARTAVRGRIYGVDHSEVMVRQASRRNRAAVRGGRVHLSCGSVADLPALDEPLDAVVAVNSMGFWPEPLARLEDLRDRLRPGGRLAIATQPRCPGATAETSRRAAETIGAMLETAGFTRTGIQTLRLDPPVVCVIGVKPDAPG